MEVKHTLSDVLARLVVDIDNMNSFLFSLQNILESKSENVNVSQTKSDGSKYSITVPSFGYLKGKIEDINSNFDTLLSTNTDVIGIKSANGDVRKFELKRTSSLISDLESIRDLAITVPTEFRVKNNWFFESFLNPLLYVNLDISGVLTEDIDQFAVKRIIFNTVNNPEAVEFFDENYLNRNDITLSNLIIDLDDNAIDYFEDDNIVSLDVAVNRFKGSFDVLRILEEEVPQILTNGTTVTTTRRKYKLNTLNYTDVIAGAQNTRILAEGDVLITQNDSEYRITSVNRTNTEIVVERIFGVEPVTVGADTLKLKPVPFRVPQLQVNVGYNERQIVFIRPISKAKNFTVDEYSNGVAVFTNNLTIPLQDDTTSTLENYYNNFVSDFGLILLNLAKEKKLPAIVAETPSAPVINTADFSVVQLDSHIQDDINITNLNNTVKEKSAVEKEISELNKKIDQLKAEITTVSKTPQEAKRLEKQLTEAQKARDEKTINLSTIVTNLTTQISTTPQFVTNKKYAVRGFWQIPNPVSSAYGKQEVVQFKYRWRYLSQNGTQPNAQQKTFTDVDGTQKSATFSPWEESLTKPRTKEINTETGLYKWSTENVSDADVVNSNQLSIPIRKGEIVEIQIKSISEAGWPDNPVESAWSSPIQVAFPENISSQEEGVVVSQKAFADKTKIDFEASLIARGLDTHLANQFTTGERFFAHKSQDISSGFFTAEGNVIDLFEQLTQIKNTLEGLQQAIALDSGVISVSLIDPTGSVATVKNGDTINLFAGYYKDLIKDTTGGATVFNEGQIITKSYVISIKNTSATALELISLLQGGINEVADDSLPFVPGSDYHRNRRYDIVPIAVKTNVEPQIGQFKQIPSLQSGQVKSQYIHSRVREYGLSEELYAPTDPSTYTLTSAYNYQGQLTPASTTIPYNWGHYLPLDPQFAFSGTSVNSKVWNGSISSGVAQGGGRLSEFCVSVNHPHLKTLGTNLTYNITNITNVFRPEFTAAAPPTVDNNATQKTLPFAHALHFETSVSENVNAFGVANYKQASRISPIAPTSNTTRTDANYPIKLGFSPNDEFLIGKYTCGAYLYAFPTSYESISVEGNFPARSTKQVSIGDNNAININVVFQFRCSDKLGYIGGYRINETLTNIKYQKKIGIDIFIKNQNPFSFDIDVAAQYTKETSLDSPVVQSQGTITSF